MAGKSFAIFISGVPGTGKTTLAMKLAQELGIDQVVSTDTVRAVLRSVGDENKNPVLFSVSHDSWKYFGEKNAQNIWKGFTAHSKLLFPVMVYMLKKSFEEGRSIIFEGVHITPEFIQGLDFPNLFSFFIIVSEDSILKDRYSMKNSFRSIPHKGWEKNFDVIRFIESKILEDKKCFTRVLENKEIFDSTNKILEVINEVLSDK